MDRSQALLAPQSSAANFARKGWGSGGERCAPYSARVSALIRLWLVPLDALPLSAGAVELLLRAAPRALYASVARHLELAAPLALEFGRDGAPVPLELAPLSGDAELRSLADRHPAASVVVLLERSDARALCARALALVDGAQSALASARFELAALDWPPSDDPQGRPALVGLDLDWLPPPPPARRAKFPGGPGSAPSGR